MYLLNVGKNAHIYGVSILLVIEGKISEQRKEEGERNGYRKMTGTKKWRML
jgi:hypothetical protein